MKISIAKEPHKNHTSKNCRFRTNYRLLCLSRKKKLNYKSWLIVMLYFYHYSTQLKRSESLLAFPLLFSCVKSIQVHDKNIDCFQFSVWIINDCRTLAALCLNPRFKFTVTIFDLRLNIRSLWYRRLDSESRINGAIETPCYCSRISFFTDRFRNRRCELKLCNGLIYC